MRSSSTAEFKKLRTCPSAETLLLYNSAHLTHPRRERIAMHLDLCDFCGAALQLLTKHPPASWFARRTELSPMPAALRRLALDLIGEPTRALAFLTETAFERERLTLTDA